MLNTAHMSTKLHNHRQSHKCMHSKRGEVDKASETSEVSVDRAMQSQLTNRAYALHSR